MIDFLLKLFGVQIDEAVKVTSASLRLRNADAIGWVLLLFLALAGLAWLVYSRGAHRGLTRWRRRVLIGLRTLVFFLILLIFLRPVVSFAVEGKIRALLVGLFDESASMRIPDPRVDAADVRRAAIVAGALDPAGGLEQSLSEAEAAPLRKLPRIEVLRRALRNDRLDLLGQFRERFDVAEFGFGKSVRQISPPPVPETAAGEPAATPVPTPSDADWIASLRAESPLTAVGDAVRQIIDSKRGQALAGIFLATDGANNSGSDVMAAASFAKAEGVPLYIYGVGITSPRDIIVASLFAQNVAFMEDELPVTVRVKGQGLAGRTAALVLTFGDKEVARQEVTFGEGETVVTMKFTPEKKGEFPLTASIAPLDEEAVKDNNSATQLVQVIDAKIKVLLVEQKARWEYRYARAELLRDRRVELRTFLADADPKVAAEKDSPYLREIPREKEELFKFDLIILGDIDPALLPPRFAGEVQEFVSRLGGALLVVAGPAHMPADFKNTPLEKMLPVEWESGAEVTRDEPEKIALELTPLGRVEPMLKLAPDEAENAEIWKNLPPIYWAKRVTRAKPAAKVLAVDPDPAKATRFGKMPVIAQQQYGLGQVLYVGTDELWRWRKNRGERHYARLWGEMAQKLAMVHLLGGNKRAQISVDKERYTTGDRVTVNATLFQENFEPVTEPAVEGFFTVAQNEAPGEPTAVSLRAVPGQPGMYRGDFVALEPGKYRVATALDPEAGAEFVATEPAFELGETAMNEATLRAMATASGGAFFREEDLHKLGETIERKAERVVTVTEVDIWSSPLYFILLLGVATTEWILRRRFQLK